MAIKRTKRIIQVPIEYDLLNRIDERARAAAESRAAFIREACKERLNNLEAKEPDRQYTEGYRKKPEDTRLADAAAEILSRALPKEEW
jgi:metal-responsive CopG/Arc/MetJ family transcriptional regulator